MFTPRPPRNASTTDRGVYASRTACRSRSTNSVRPCVGNWGSVARRARRRSTRSRIIRCERHSALKSPGLRRTAQERLDLLRPLLELLLAGEEVERLLLEDHHALVDLALRFRVVEGYRGGGLRRLDLRSEPVELLAGMREPATLLLDLRLAVAEGLLPLEELIRTPLEGLLLPLDLTSRLLELVVARGPARAPGQVRGAHELPARAVAFRRRWRCGSAPLALTQCRRELRLHVLDLRLRGLAVLRDGRARVLLHHPEGVLPLLERLLSRVEGGCRCRGGLPGDRHLLLGTDLRRGCQLPDEGRLGGDQGG